MDNSRAAGSRIKLDTFDQAPSARQSNRTFQSSIFSNEPAPVQTPRTQQQRKSDIFSSQVTVQTPTSRTHQTFQSTIFQDAPVSQKQSRPVNDLSKSQIFSNQADPKLDKKGFQAKNNEHRAQDHGKDFLFGKSDYTDYKLRRVQTQSNFQPKHDYDPQERQLKELYGGEISKDHLPTSKLATQKKQEAKRDQNEFDPATKREQDLSSSIFSDGSKRQYNKVNKNFDALNHTISEIGGEHEYDPDTYAKQRKEKELSSSIFGNGSQSRLLQRRQTMQAQTTTNNNIDEKKKKNQQISEVFGVKDIYMKQQPQKQKERLLATNTTWTQVDSVKNLKDFAPGTELQDVENSLIATPSQKKFQVLKSVLDTHQYQATEVTDKSEKLSVKNLKYKGDILSREDKKSSLQQKTVNQLAKNTQKKQVAQPDKESVI